MPLKSKAQERFLWAKHPKMAQEFEDATPSGAKLPEHVQKMAGGGVAGDDWMQGVNDFLGKLYGVKKDDVPRETIPQVESPHPSTPIVPVSTNSGAAEEVPSQTENEAKIQDSHPGHTAEDLSGLDKYIQGQEKQVDQYGPEQEKAVIENILKSRNSVGNRLGQAISGAGDAAMIAFTGQNPNFEKNFNEERGRTEDLASSAIPTLQKMGAENRAEKEKYEGMTSSSPLGSATRMAYEKVFKQLFPAMKADDLAKLTANPSIAARIFPELGPIIEKQVQAEIQKENIDINRQRLTSETANQATERQLNAQKQLAEIGIKRYLPQYKALVEQLEAESRGQSESSTPAGGWKYVGKVK